MGAIGEICQPSFYIFVAIISNACCNTDCYHEQWHNQGIIFVTLTMHEYKYVVVSSKSAKKPFLQFEIWEQRCADDAWLLSCAGLRMFSLLCCG